jgi:hypothetical protein
MIGQPADLLTYSNHSSLIVSVHAIMTCLAVAACNKEYTKGKIDIKGAFSQMKMSRMPVYINCMGTLK